jgi:hypothetical protein
MEKMIRIYISWQRLLKAGRMEGFFIYKFLGMKIGALFGIGGKSLDKKFFNKHVFNNNKTSVSKIKRSVSKIKLALNWCLDIIIYCIC